MVIAVLNCSNIIYRCVVNTRKSNIRFVSLRNIKETCTKYLRSEPPNPPYKHVCQVGDPVLRQKARPINPKEIGTVEFDNALEQLREVQRREETYGLAAPQIGLSWQLFAIEVTKKMLDEQPPDIQQTLEMEVVPLTYFINPTMEILNPTKVKYFECCASIIGYTAVVERAKEVKITALNRFGKQFTWTAKGYTARIAQHELDHLHGILFTDKMDPSTFENPFWQEINRNNGGLLNRIFSKNSHK